MLCMSQKSVYFVLNLATFVLKTRFFHMLFHVVCFTPQVWSIIFCDLCPLKWIYSNALPSTILSSELPYLQSPDFFHELDGQGLTLEKFSFFLSYNGLFLKCDGLFFQGSFQHHLGLAR